MAKRWIDTHTHYAHKRFDCRREDILDSLPGAGIAAVIEGAIEYESNYRMLSLCEKYPFMFMTAACHPNCVEDMDETKYALLAKLAEHEKVVAIGETGLDYSRTESKEAMELQQRWFRRFIELSLHTGKPMVIHCREAYSDLIGILSEYQLLPVPGVIHCFNGNCEDVRRLTAMGFYIGVNGMITKQGKDSELRRAIQSTPLDRILLETDAPYLVPAGAKGARNTSLNLIYVVETLEGIYPQDADRICDVILQNTRQVYPKIFEDNR